MHVLTSLQQQLGAAGMPVIYHEQAAKAIQDRVLATLQRSGIVEAQ
jgi:hypothetical protein